MQYHNIVGGAGVQLHAVETGNPDGQAILFIHGWSRRGQHLRRVRRVAAFRTRRCTCARPSRGAMTG